ncbi:hypothetical protein, partial [Escherichia coli]|uniref:hypothetical protein n=1 Tax=Escherichia coli TaxID=562 RepID=UPI001BAF1DE3
EPTPEPIMYANIKQLNTIIAAITEYAQISRNKLILLAVILSTPFTVPSDAITSPAPWKLPAELIDALIIIITTIDAILSTNAASPHPI